MLTKIESYKFLKVEDVDFKGFKVKDDVIGKDFRLSDEVTLNLKYIYEYGDSVELNIVGIEPVLKQGLLSVVIYSNDLKGLYDFICYYFGVIKGLEFLNFIGYENK